MFTGVYPIDRYSLQHRCRIYDTLYSAHFRFVRVRFKRRFTISRRYGKHIYNFNRECIPRCDATEPAAVLSEQRVIPFNGSALSFNYICFK